MVEPVYYIRSYSVAPSVRGSPVLTILTDKQRMQFTGKGIISSLVRAASKGAPFRARLVSRETPTGGKFQVFERIEES